MLNFGIVTPKSTSLSGTTSFDVFCVNIRGGVLAVGGRKHCKNGEVNNLLGKVALARKRKLLFYLDKILWGGRRPRLITCANLFDDRLRGLWMTGVKFC